MYDMLASNMQKKHSSFLFFLSFGHCMVRAKFQWQRLHVWADANTHERRTFCALRMNINFSSNISLFRTSIYIYKFSRRHRDRTRCVPDIPWDDVKRIRNCDGCLLLMRLRPHCTSTVHTQTLHTCGSLIILLGYVGAPVCR